MCVRLGPSGSLYCVQTYDQMGHFNVGPPYSVKSISFFQTELVLDEFQHKSCLIFSYHYLKYVNEILVTRTFVLALLSRTGIRNDQFHQHGVRSKKGEKVCMNVPESDHFVNFVKRLPLKLNSAIFGDISSNRKLNFKSPLYRR